jgi:hypothetical protein
MQPNLTPPLERSSICSVVIGGHASGPFAARHDVGKITYSGSVGFCRAGWKVLRKDVKGILKTRSTIRLGRDICVGI